MSNGNESDEIKRKVLQKFEGIAYGIALETGLPVEYACTDEVIPKTWWERGIHRTEEGKVRESERYRDRNAAGIYGVEPQRYRNYEMNSDENICRTKTEVVKEEIGIETINKGQFRNCCTAAATENDDNGYRGKCREIESIETEAAVGGKKITERKLYDEELVYSDDDDDDGDDDPFPALLLEEKENSRRLTPSPIPVQCSESTDEEEFVTPWFEPVEPALYVSGEYLDLDEKSFSQGEMEISATGNNTELQQPPPKLSLEEELQWVRHALCSRISVLKYHHQY